MRSFKWWREKSAAAMNLGALCGLRALSPGGEGAAQLWCPGQGLEGHRELELHMSSHPATGPRNILLPGTAARTQPVPEHHCSAAPKS